MRKTLMALGLATLALSSACKKTGENEYKVTTPDVNVSADTHTVTTEFVHLDQGRGLANLAFLAAQTNLRQQMWRGGSAEITGLPLEFQLNRFVVWQIASRIADH